MQVEPLYNSWREIGAMHIELTNRCNAACSMCPRYIDNGAAENPNLTLTEVTLEQFKTWFPPDYIKQLRRVYACGNYGDPIAAKDTLEIFKYMRECNDRLALVLHTNGSARSTKWWEELGSIMRGENHADDSVVFSVDGLWDTNHLYRRNTNFDKIYANMKAYTSAGGVAKWDFIAFDYNEHQVDEARELAREMGFRFFNVKRTTRWQGYDQDGRGYYQVKNPDGTSYYLRQPLNPALQHDNDTEFKKVVKNGLVPEFVTNDEFARLMPEGTEEFYSMYDNQTKEHMKIKHNTMGIMCRAKIGPYQSNNEIFLSATGHVFPCCFLGGEPWRSSTHSWNPNDTSLKMIELNGGMDSISLHNKTLEEIINTPYYQRYLPLSFERGSNMRSYQCSSCCGQEFNKLDQGELGVNSRVIGKVKKDD